MATAHNRADRPGEESRELSNRDVFQAIGAFMDRHGLDPSPANYALVFRAVREPESQIGRMIGDMTSDGLRFTQRDADDIRASLGLAEDTDAMPEPILPAIDTLASVARRSIEGFSQVVQETHDETQRYGADLERNQAELSAVESITPTLSRIARITASMVDRTRAAEVQLAAARSEAETLREQLAEAEVQARSDPLTQLPNRRAFEDRLAELVAHGGIASIAICDIDRFKRINDGHGHGVGDRVLRVIAQTLQAACPGHMVARLGGEEFVILFDGLAPDEAGSIIDHARERLAARDFKVRGTDRPLGQVTFSAGVASCRSREGQEVPLKRADTLLYEAKNSGRNKVLVEAA